jgi:hypothetical protein
MPPIKPAAPVVDASIQGESISTGTPKCKHDRGDDDHAPGGNSTRSGHPERKTATRAPDTKAMGAFKSAEDAQAYISQQRRSGGTVSGALVLPNEDGTFGVATKDHPDYAKAQAFKKTQDQRAAGILEGDILSKSGEPFKSEAARVERGEEGRRHARGGPGEGRLRRTAEGVAALPRKHGTLGIPRADMPQVKTEHHGALVNFLNARGVEHQTEEVDPNTLKPTQAEYSPQRVEAVGKAVSDSDRSILVSSDGHVLDGHHQWLAAGANGEPVKVIKLSKPAAEVLPLMKEFPSAQTSEGAEHAAHEQGTITEAAKEAKAPAADESAKGSGEAPGPDTRADRAGDDGSEKPAAVAEPKGEPHAPDEQHEQSRVRPEREDGDAGRKTDEAGGGDRVQPATKGEEADRGTTGGQGDHGVLNQPAKPKRESKAARAAREAEEARAAYFTPGNIVKSYGGFDEVLSYTPPAAADANAWSVRVQEVKRQDDGTWKVVGKPRTHTTQPSAKDLKSGPVGKMEGAMFSRRTPAEHKAAKNALNELSKLDDMFQLPKSDKNTIEGIAADNDPQVKVEKGKAMSPRARYGT